MNARKTLPVDIPLKFGVILSACRVFLGTEEPAKLEALLQREGQERDMLHSPAN